MLIVFVNDIHSRSPCLNRGNTVDGSETYIFRFDKRIPCSGTSTDSHDVLFDKITSFLEKNVFEKSIFQEISSP